MRKSVNILFLGGAKRVSMARMFVASGAKMDIDVNIFSYELSAEVPVAEVATVIVGRRWSDTYLMADLHNVVKERCIDILLPFVDPAIEVAARYCAADIGCWTPFVDETMAGLLFDKVAADAKFRQLGFPLPANALTDSVNCRVIAKPRYGSASKGITVLDQEEFIKLRDSDCTNDCIYQEYVACREEYTVDCYVSRTGQFVCAVPRKRIEVSGGEVTVTQTLHDAEIEDTSRRVLCDLGLRGAVTIQFLRGYDDSGCMENRYGGKLMLMEINPRLGGGSVCSVHAGADLPRYILLDWQGGNIGECKDWKPGVKICRYMQEVVFYDGKTR